MSYDYSNKEDVVKFLGEVNTAIYGVNPFKKEQAVETSCWKMSCQQEEQCDECFAIDHAKVCDGCSGYDHDDEDAKVWTSSAECQHKMINSTAKLCDTCVVKK